MKVHIIVWSRTSPDDYFKISVVHEVTWTRTKRNTLPVHITDILEKEIKLTDGNRYIEIKQIT